MRRRYCADCCHKWYTVEVSVPDYAVGWCSESNNKPVLRVPMELDAGFTPTRVSHVPEQDAREKFREHYDRLKKSDKPAA